MADSLPDIVIPEKQWVGIRQQYAIQHPSINSASYSNSNDRPFQNKSPGKNDIICFTSSVEPTSSFFYEADGEIVAYKEYYTCFAGDNETWVWSDVQGRGNLGELP